MKLLVIWETNSKAKRNGTVCNWKQLQFMTFPFPSLLSTGILSSPSNFPTKPDAYPPVSCCLNGILQNSIQPNPTRSERRKSDKSAGTNLGADHISREKKILLIPSLPILSQEGCRDLDKISGRNSCKITTVSPRGQIIFLLWPHSLSFSLLCMLMENTPFQLSRDTHQFLHLDQNMSIMNHEIARRAMLKLTSNGRRRKSWITFRK